MNSLSGTRWRGRVGRAPASLEIFPRTAGGDWTARVRYTGIAEDLAVTINANGSVVLTGKTYRREFGAGAFALDTFSGQLSADGQHIRGTLIDGSGLRGQWNVTKIENLTQSLAPETTNLLSPDVASTTHWQGTIGTSPLSLDIFPRKDSSEWAAKAIYRGVIEDLAVVVQNDGTVVLAGRSYQWESGSGPFSLSTFYGEISDDGKHLQGLRIDASGGREPWEVRQ